MSTQIEDTDAEALPLFSARFDGGHIVVSVPGPLEHGDESRVNHHIDLVTATKLFAQLGVACQKASFRQADPEKTYIPENDPFASCYALLQPNRSIPGNTKNHR